MKECLNQKDYEDIARLQKLCMEVDQVNLKLEIDYKLQLGEAKRETTNEINEFMCYNEGNELIAYIGICDFGGDAMEVHGMVDPEYRRKGVFSRLYSLVKDEWFKRQAPKMLLLSDNSSTSGLGFIKSTGARYAFSEHELFLRDYSKLKIDSSKVTLRKASNEDAEEVERIYGKCFDEEYREENIVMPEDEEKLGIIYYIAEVDNRPIGKINLAIGKIGSIYGFGILPEYRGMGLGRETLIRSIEKLKEHNCEDIMIQVESLNTNAIKLYKSCGFVETSTMDYYEMTK